MDTKICWCFGVKSFQFMHCRSGLSMGVRRRVRFVHWVVDANSWGVFKKKNRACVADNSASRIPISSHFPLSLFVHTLLVQPQASSTIPIIFRWPAKLCRRHLRTKPSRFPCMHATMFFWLHLVCEVCIDIHCHMSHVFKYSSVKTVCARHVSIPGLSLQDVRMGTKSLTSFQRFFCVFTHASPTLAGRCRATSILKLVNDIYYMAPVQIISWISFRRASVRSWRAWRECLELAITLQRHRLPGHDFVGSWKPEKW